MNITIQHSLLLACMLCIQTGFSQFQPFIIEVETTTPNENITIPTHPAFAGQYNYEIDWENDGNNDEAATGDATHTYATAGFHKIAIYSDFPAIYINNNAERHKFLDILQWGDVEWFSMNKAFFGADNLIISASDQPNLNKVSSMKWSFKGAISFNSNINGWNVSQVTDMSGMFWGAANFNQPLNGWNVSSVTDMSNMFNEANEFNQPLDSFDVSQVTNMYAMFNFASNFNQPLNNWDVILVTNMSFMFTAASNFNQPINEWKVSQVTNMYAMFRDASNFNQPLNKWDVCNVSDISHMFSNASNFNQPLNNWDVSNVTAMMYTFINANSFNQDIGAWDISKVEEMVAMLINSGISQLNYDSILIKWNDQPTFPDVMLGAAGLEYCNGASAHASLMTTNGWIINGDSENCINAQPCTDTQVNTYMGPTTGSWNDASNWFLGTVPSPCDDVVIPIGKIISLSNAAECYSLEISVGSEVEFEGHVLTVWNL